MGNGDSNSGDIYIKNSQTPYAKSLLKFKNGYPISWYVCSPDMRHIVALKGSECFPNSKELVLYRLKVNKLENVTFTISNPRQYLSDSFKKEFDRTQGVGLWVDVFEPKINPLNDKVVGSKPNTFKGTMKVISVDSDGSLVLSVGYHISILIKDCTEDIWKMIIESF